MTLALWLVACASRDFAEPRPTDEATVLGGRISVDVLPPASASVDEIVALPTTELRDLGPEPETDLGTFRLRTPLVLTGALVATRLLPTAASLPGESVPVVATIRVERPGTLASWNARTTDQGEFEALLAPGNDHVLSVVPDDPLLPAYVGRLGDPEAFGTLDLGYGAPLYGRVVRSTGGPADGVEGARVRAVSPEGLETTPVVTDGFGFWQMRVSAGTWTVLCDGAEDTGAPTVTALDVETDADGTQVDFVRPEISAALVRGTVRGSDGRSLVDAVVRIRSESLVGYGVEGSFSDEVTVSADGSFLMQAPPGTYTFEVLPTLDDEGRSAAGPASRSGVVVEDGLSIDLEASRLRPVVVSVTADGSAVANARVACTDTEFDGREFVGFTASGGRVELPLPPIPLVCEVSPPGNRGDLASSRFRTDGGDRSVRAWELPRGITVTGLVDLEGAPTANAVVQIRDELGVPIGFAVTNDEGRFTLQIEP